jgi:hypothetical protein
MKTYLLTLLLVLVGCKIAQAQTMQLDKQEAVIAAILKLGGTLERDEQRPGKPVIKVDLHQTQITDATWCSCRGCRNCAIWICG